MKLLWWMLSGSALSALALSVFVEGAIRRDLWLGMLGPLAAALASWVAMKRMYGRRPAALTSLMIKAFAAKMMFFAAYVTVLVKTNAVQPAPFAISFVSYFILLHAIEAIGLQRLQATIASDS